MHGKANKCRSPYLRYQLYEVQKFIPNWTKVALTLSDGIRSEGNCRVWVVSKERGWENSELVETLETRNMVAIIWPKLIDHSIAE